MYRPQVGDRVWVEVSGVPLKHFCGVRVCRGKESFSDPIYWTAREPVAVWGGSVTDEQAEKNKLAKIVGVLLGCRLEWNAEGRDFCTVTEVFEGQAKENLKAIAEDSASSEDDQQFNLSVLQWAEVIRDRAKKKPAKAA
jgi:hypothetical protein